MEYGISCRCYLKSAFRTLELPATIYQPILPATGAFTRMLAIKDKLQTRFLIWKVVLKTINPILCFFTHISSIAKANYVVKGYLCSYPQGSVCLVLGLVYNANEVGKSGKSVDNVF